MAAPRRKLRRTRRPSTAPGTEPRVSADPEPAATGPVSPGLLPGSKAYRVDAAAARAATWALRLLAIAAAVVVLAWVAAQAWVVLFPAAIGLMAATLLEPAVRRLRPRLGSAGAAAVVLLAAAGFAVAVVAVLTPQVAGQVRPLAINVADGLANLRDLAVAEPFGIGATQIGDALDDAATQLRAHALSIGGGVLNGLVSVGSVLLTGLLAAVMCFFVLKDGPRFVPWAASIVGPSAAPHLRIVATRLWDAVAGFVRAQALVGLVDAVAVGIVLVVLGVPLAVPLAVLMFAGSFIPIVGALVTGAVAALVALVAGGPMTALAVVIAVVVINQVEGNLLAPLLLGRSLALHPVVIISAVTVGAAMSGVVGAVLAVPAAATIAVVFRYALEQLDTVPTNADPVADPVADPDASGT